LFRGTKDRLAKHVFWRPILPFVLEFVVLAPLILADDPASSIGGVVFLLPWLLLFFALINLPFVRAAFQAFHLDRETRRNHALEHATIHFLEAGSRRRLSGRAVRDGFRVEGRASAYEIKKAFERVRHVVRDGDRLPYISRRCGSNVVSALGLALLLLVSVAVVSVLLQPPLIIRASALGGVVVLFVAARHGLGNWMQRRFFMLTDFEEVSLRDVREVPAGPMERRPVHFVATMVRARARDAV
jgi:Domain of unknown function (DUF6391)